MSDEITNILEELKNLTEAETSELVKQIENTFHVDASLNHLVQTNLIDDSGYFDIIDCEEAEVSVIIDEAPGGSKIAILKAIRTLTNLGLKETKEIIDSVPRAIFSDIPRDEAEGIKKQLESAGAKVSLK